MLHTKCNKTRAVPKQENIELLLVNMEPKHSTTGPKRAEKFRPPTEAREKLTGTFESGKLKEEVGEISPGENRGSDHTDVQFGLPGVEVTSEVSKPNETPNPDQQDYFTNTFNRSDPYRHCSGNTARTVGVSSCTLFEYPQSSRIVAVHVACTRSLILKQTFMVQVAELQNDGNGQNVAPIQVAPIVRPFFMNMEADVPFELVQI